MVQAQVVVALVVVAAGTIAAIFLLIKQNEDAGNGRLSLLNACLELNGDDISVCDELKGVDWLDNFNCIEGSVQTWNYEGMYQGWKVNEDEVGVENYLKEACEGATPTDRRDLAEGYSAGRNYGPCSMSGDFLLNLNGGIDAAECSGLSVFRANKAVSCQAGDPKCCTAPVANWPRRTTGKRQDKLVNGCYNHDYCLQKGGTAQTALCGASCTGCEAGGVTYNGNGQRDCDKDLADQAWWCATRRWWSSTKCDDSATAAVAVWVAMKTGPNEDFCLN